MVEARFMFGPGLETTTIFWGLKNRFICLEEENNAKVRKTEAACATFRDIQLGRGFTNVGNARVVMEVQIASFRSLAADGLETSWPTL